MENTMAKQGKYGELNWHKGSKRWYKKVKNTETGKFVFHYFGTKGNGPSDRACRKVADAEYATWKQEQDVDAKIKKVHQLTVAVEAGLIPITDLGDSPFELNFIQSLKRAGMLRPDGYLNQNVAEPDEETAAARSALYARLGLNKPKPQKRSRTITQHVDDWLAAEKLNVGKGMVLGSWVDKEKGIKTFREFIKSDRFSKDQSGVDKMLMDYRAHLLRCMDNPTSKINSPNTFNDKTKFCKQFIVWCWKSSVLKDQPRRLEDFAAKLHVEKKGHPLSLDDITKLWAAAGPKMKCYIAMGLNFGFKNGDITSTTGKMIRGKRLIGIREKSKKLKVSMNYPVWPLTAKLITENRDRTEDDELLFVNKKGGRIKTGTFSQMFKKIAEKAGVKATFEQLRDTSVMHVRDELLKAGADLSLVQIFLAHKDKGTEQYYLPDDPALLKAPVLDKIVMKLQKIYRLK